MMIALLNVSLFFLLIYCYRRVRHGYHILQLENYYNDRYAHWMRLNLKKVLDIKSIILFIFPIVLVYMGEEKIALIAEIIVLIVLSLLFRRSKEKKAFVVTARIKRMYITNLIMFFIIGLLLNTLDLKVMIIALNVVAILSYVLVYLTNLINRPIENAIRAKFARRAKKALKGIPNLKVIGITGSYGKTSTKYAVNTILSQKYNTLMTPESYNTTMGVVRTINEKLSPMHQLFICEMGAKYIGDIKEITDIVEPTYGILTAIGPQHLDTFKTLENVSKTKLELVDSLPDDGVAFVNWEDENIRKVKFTKKIVKYGLNSKADYYATNIEITERGSVFDVVLKGKDKISIKTKLLGKLNILNIVAAIAVGDYLGLSEEEIKTGVKFLRPVKHRLEMKQNPNGSITIDDAYNSNVRGASMALEVLKNFKGRNRILITPGIVELGDKGAEYNKEFGKEAAQSADFIILVGAKQAVPIYEGIKAKKYPQSKVYIAENLDEALKKMNEIMDGNSVILFENDLPDNYL